MKKNESNGDEARYQTTDSSIEADATVAKKDIPKMRIAIGLAIGAAVGVGIGLLVGRKLDFGPLPSAAKAKVTTIESVKSATANIEAGQCRLVSSKAASKSKCIISSLGIRRIPRSKPR